MDEVYVIVSDLHLGSEGSHQAEFCRFLRWLTLLPPQGRILEARCVKTGDHDPARRTVTVRPPTTVVLLGDILELWDPEEHNRDNVVRDAIEPLSLLHDLESDKVYVTGNHDQDVAEIARQVRVFPWKGKNSFSLHPRHYPEPEKGVNRGIDINGIRYSFLHGHQYDRQQVTHTLSKILETRFDPMDMIGDLANVSFTKSVTVLGMALIAGAWVFFTWLFVGSPPPLVTDTAVGAVMASVSILLLLHYPRARRILDERRSTSAERTIIGGIFLGPAFATILLFGGTAIQGSYPFDPVPLLLPLILFVLTFLLLAAAIPKGISCISRRVYTWLGVKDRSVEEVLRDGYVASKDTLDVDVILFGHTHRAGWAFRSPESGTPSIRQGRTRLFLNTGCWMEEPDARPVNTFAYLDGEGVSLLEWRGEDEITCLFHAPREIVSVLR